MPYQFPPWIQPPESLARNFGAGVAAGQNQQEMQLRAQSDAAKLQLAQQAQLQEEAYRARQQGISEQELAMNQQLSAAKVREIQQAFDARQQYQQAIQSGMDPLEAAQKHLVGIEPLTGLWQLARQKRLDTNAQVPPSLVNFPDPNNPGRMLSFVKHPTEGGYGLTPAHEYGSDRETLPALDKEAIDYLFFEKRRLQDDIIKLDADGQLSLALAKPDSPAAKIPLKRLQDLQDKMAEVDDAIGKFYRERGRAGPGALKGTAPPLGTGRVKIISVEDLPESGATAPPPGSAPPGAAIAPPTAPSGNPIRAAQALGLSLGQNVMGAVNAPGVNPKVADSLQDWWSGLFGPTQGP